MSDADHDAAAPLPESNGPPVDFADDGLPPVVLVPVAPPRPWGPWASLGWTVLVLVVMVVIQNLVAIAFVAVWLAQGRHLDPAEVAANGNLIAAAAIVAAPAVVGLVYLLISFRRCSPRDYLALRRPRPRAALVAFVGLAAVLAASDTVTYLLGRPVVPQVMVAAYRTSWPPLVLVALLVAAPLSEETLMRGFLFRGIAAPRWGPAAAIVLSALVWSMIHVQYDLYGIGLVFVLGLYLGFVRHRTESVPLTMALHSVANAVASAEVIIQVEWLGR